MTSSDDEVARILLVDVDSDEEEPQASEQGCVDAASLRFSAFKVSATGIFILQRWLPLQDVGSDEFVTFGPGGLYWDEANPWWGHLSVLFIVLPYVLLWILISPLIVPVIEATLDNAGIWLCFQATQRCTSCCLWVSAGCLFIMLSLGVSWSLFVFRLFLVLLGMSLAYDFLYMCVWAFIVLHRRAFSIALWSIFGLPFCMFLDLMCLVRYPWWQPRLSWLLNTLRLRVVLETILESPAQVGLQMRIFIVRLMSSDNDMHEDFHIMAFGALLFSICTSVLSAGLTIQDIRAMSQEQRIGFWEALSDQFLVGLGRKAPLLHVVKFQEDVDWVDEGKLQYGHFKQISASASNSQTLHTLTFHQSNELSKTDFLSLFEFTSRRKHPLMSRVIYIAERDGDWLWCGCGRFTVDELKLNEDIWASGKVHLELHDVIPAQRLEEIAEYDSGHYSRVHVVSAGVSGSHELFTDEALTEFAQWLPATAASIDFNFHRQDMLTDDGLKVLVQRLPASATSIRLNFRGSKNITDDGLKGLAKGLPAEATRIHLGFIGNNMFTDHGLEELVQRLPTVATDVHLNFRKNNNFTDYGLKALAKGLPDKATYVHVDCGWNDKFTDDGLKELAQSLPSVATDVHLSFMKNNNFTDDGLKALAKGLPDKATSVHLDFGENDKFTDDGLKPLAKGLATAASIDLDFSSNDKITNAMMMEEFSAEGQEHKIIHIKTNTFLLMDSPSHANRVPLSVMFMDDGLKSWAQCLKKDAVGVHVDFRSEDTFTDDGLRALARRLPATATHIHLCFRKNSKFTDDGLKELAQSLPTAATDVHLNFMTNNNFTDDGLKALAKGLPAKATHVHLDCEGNAKFTDHGLKELAQSLPTAATDVHLNFTKSNNFTDDGLKALANGLPDKATNVHLNFGENDKFSDHGLKALAKRLPRNATHVHLDFGGNGFFSDDGLKELAQSLPTAATDVHLNFTKSNFTDDGLEALAKGLPDKATNVHLDFGENDKFSDHGLKALARRLPRNATHVHLDFGRNDLFSDDGLKELAQSLPIAATDVHLNFMTNNNFTDDGLKALAKGLPVLATDINLNFARNKKFTEAGFAVFKKNLPAAAIRIDSIEEQKRNYDPVKQGPEDAEDTRRDPAIPESGIHSKVSHKKEDLDWGREFSDPDIISVFEEEYNKANQTAEEHDLMCDVRACARVAPVAWRYAFGGTAVLWSMWLLAPVMAFLFSTCQDDDLSGVPALLGLAAVPAVLANCWGEWQAAKLMHPVSLRVLGPYKLCGRITLPFGLWRAGLLVISFAINFEVFTSGAFAGRVMHTATQCQSSSKVPDLWRRAASLGIFPGAWSSLGVVCFLAWLVMPLEALYCVLVSVPKRGPDAKKPWESSAFSLGDLIRLREPPKEAQGFLITAFDDHVVVSSSVLTLSQVGRMEFLGCRLRDMEQRFMRDRVPSYANVRRLLANEVFRNAVRAAFTLPFTAAMSNLQVSLLETSNSASGSLDRITAASIALTMLFFVYKLYKLRAALVEEFFLFWPHRNVREPAFGKFRGEDVGQPSVNRNRVILAVGIFSTSAACSIGLMMWSVSKFVVGTFVCESWVYTWSGCQPLDAALSAPASG